MIMNTLFVLCSMSLGMQVSCYTLIGKSIGAMDIPLAKRYRKMLTMVGVSLQLTECISLYALRGYVVQLYTELEDVQKLSVDGMQVVAFCVFFDCC